MKFALRNMLTGGAFATFLFFFSMTSQGQSLFSIDASGNSGRDGSAGSSYGSSGSSGGNAGSSSRGENGGNININVQSDEAKQGVLVIRGVYEKSGSPGDITKKIEIGNSGYIYLNAQGGKGGNGGAGGNGAAGSEGSRGSDATQYSSGTNGGDGGNGGNGGDGTSGSNGGNGGTVHVNVSFKDTHLLMLFDQDVSGGQGGSSGSNGMGGAGGSGGSGGSSYSWSERVYAGQTCSNSCSLSSNGNGSYTNSCHQSCTDNYNNVSHSNPGGYSGSSGSRRSDRRGNISAGANGQNGNFLIQVKDENGQVRQYTKRYDLELQGFNSVAKANNGIFEPGDSVIVSQIRVRNTGGMPTPPNYRAMIYLNDNKWVLSNGAQVVIPESIAPGASYTLSTPLSFRIADVNISKEGDRFREGSVVEPLSYLEGVNRPFTHFSRPQNFEVTFPIEITPISAPQSLEPGTKAHLFWKVTNISTKSFGTDSPVGRRIQNILKLSSDKTSQKYGQLDFNGVQIQNGFLKEVLKLGPGESTIIEGMVSIAPGAPYYSKVGLNVGLDISKIDDKTKTELIQTRNFDIRISKTYDFDKDTNFLLITNNQTTEEEINAWGDLTSHMGLKMAVWDLSFYGFLDLSRKIRSDKNLRDDFYKKTVVVLNNQFHSNQGNLDPLAVAAKNDFLSAVTQSGISLYIVGCRPEDVQGFLLPPLGQLSGEYADLDKYYKLLSDKTASLKDPLYNNKIFGPYIDFYDQIHQSGWYLLSEPKESTLIDRARKLMTELQKKYPNKTYMVLYEYNPPTVKEEKTLGKTWGYGNLYVRRIGAAGTGNVIGLDVDDNRIHSSQFVMGRENVLSLMMAMRFSEKLSYLSRLLKQQEPLDLKTGRFESNISSAQLSDQDYLNTIVDSMISDLAHEHRLDQNLETSGWGGFNLKYEIWNLRKLARFQTPTWVTPDTAIGKALIRLAAGIKFINWNDDNIFLSTTATKASQVFLEQFIDVAMGGVKNPIPEEVFDKNKWFLGQWWLERKTSALQNVSSTEKSEREKINKDFRKAIDGTFKLSTEYATRSYKPQSFSDYFSYKKREDFRFDMITNPLSSNAMTSLQSEIEKSSRIESSSVQSHARSKEADTQNLKQTYEDSVNKEKKMLVPGKGVKQ